MVKFSVKALALGVVALSLLLGLGSVALAASWPDLDSNTLMAYGLTTDQVAQISVGYPDGNWQPWREVTQGQLLKMAKTGFNTDTVDLAGIGFTGEGDKVTRQQAIAVLARLVAAAEGFDLKAMSQETISDALAAFGDKDSVSSGLRAEMAFAVSRALVKGNAQHNLAPGAVLNRIQAAALITRAMGAQFRLDSEDSGTTITVKVGDIIQVVLKGNPTTGYTWTPSLSEQDASILEQMGEPGYVSDSNLIGAGGTYTYRFKALKAGEATLKLVYARVWESVPPLETFSVTVKVLEAPLEGTSWKLEGWSISSLYPGNFEITATFKDGSVSGKSAVNQYSGPYVAGKNGSFSVGAIISTKMAGPEPAMRAETIYFELLSQARNYRITNGRLILLDANLNEQLIFAPAVTPTP
jgi:inhibitor of cysteine peptidase